MRRFFDVLESVGGFFDVVTYTGNGSTQSITSLDFQPDLVWIKSRSQTHAHYLHDSVRGVTKTLNSNEVYAEGTVTNGVTSFDTNGFSIGNSIAYNVSSQAYVAWCFKGGGAAVSNTDGTITSQVSANKAAGFSIVKFNGGNSSGNTVGHGLSSAPELIIVKNTSDIASWPVLTQTGYTIGATTFTLSASSNYLALNSTTGYTSYVFDQQLGGTANGGLSSDELIAYCFHSVVGYQKVGTYTGTGVSGNSITTGFQPRFVMIKKTSGADNWRMYDSVRNGAVLYPNLSAIEDLPGHISFDSDGFTWLTENSNATGSNYIYLAIK